MRESVQRVMHDFITEFEPAGMFCLVRRLKMESTTTTGKLIVPETSYNSNLFCEMLKKGSGYAMENGVKIVTDACEGDHVLIRQYHDHDQPIRGRTDVFVTTCQLIEGRLSCNPWPCDLPPALERKYQQLGLCAS